MDMVTEAAEEEFILKYTVCPLFTLISVANPLTLVSLKSGTPHSEMGFPGKAFSVTMAFCEKTKFNCVHRSRQKRKYFLMTCSPDLVKWHFKHHKKQESTTDYTEKTV
jgi:hypothetical protein